MIPLYDEHNLMNRILLAEKYYDTPHLRLRAPRTAMSWLGSKVLATMQVHCLRGINKQSAKGKVHRMPCKHLASGWQMALVVGGLWVVQTAGRLPGSQLAAGVRRPRAAETAQLYNNKCGAQEGSLKAGKIALIIAECCVTFCSSESLER